MYVRVWCFVNGVDGKIVLFCNVVNVMFGLFLWGKYFVGGIGWDGEVVEVGVYYVDFGCDFEVVFWVDVFVVYVLSLKGVGLLRDFLDICLGYDGMEVLFEESFVLGSVVGSVGLSLVSVRGVVLVDDEMVGYIKVGFEGSVVIIIYFVWGVEEDWF